MLCNLWQVVLGKAHNVGEIFPLVTGRCNELANRGLRSLGIARAIGEVTDGESQAAGLLGAEVELSPKLTECLGLPAALTRESVGFCQFEKCCLNGVCLALFDPASTA